MKPWRMVWLANFVSKRKFTDVSIAGIPIDNLVGSDTSCFVGSFSKDYSEMVAVDPEDMPLYFGVGTGTAILSNRISWYFDLRGPSISIDTACSSALVALHLGCQSIRTGESKAVSFTDSNWNDSSCRCSQLSEVSISCWSREL